MATFNVNIPRFYCLLRKEFLYDGEAHHGEFVSVCVFGAASLHGRALGFHVLTENGPTISGNAGLETPAAQVRPYLLPIHSLCHKPDTSNLAFDWRQFCQLTLYAQGSCRKLAQEHT